MEARGQHAGMCSFFPPVKTQGANSYHHIWQHLYTLNYHHSLKSLNYLNETMSVTKYADMKSDSYLLEDRNPVS